MITGGDTPDPHGDYLLGMTKTSRDRYLPTGPKQNHPAQLYDISGEQMELLLGFISTALLTGWFRNIPGRMGWLHSGSTVAYMVGVGATLGLLLYYGACQLFGWIPMFSMQHMLLIAGLVALSGSVGLLLYSIATKPL